MKNLFSITVIILMAGIVLFPVQAGAQAPEKLSYQAVIRDAEGNLVTGQEVGVRIRILQGSADGAVVYSEAQTPETNANGLVTVEIGGEDATVESGVFAAIDWSAGPFFIETGTDPSGGTDYTITGTSQLLSVPYALHAKTAGTISGAIVEEDPVFAVSPVAGIEAADIAGWDEAYSWGDHSLQDYLTEFDEADPLFSAAPAAGIEAADIAGWDEAYSWGDHSLQDYLTEFDEADPLFSAAPAAAIEAIDIAGWDEAYSWGDHAQEGYLTDFTEEDPTVPLHVKEIEQDDINSWNAAYGIGDAIDVAQISVGGQPVVDATARWVGVPIDESDPHFASWDRSAGILITEDQITDLRDYLTKLPDGSTPGEMMYWNGTAWVAVEPGQYGQTLNFCNGVPTWGECPASVPVVTTGAVTNITPTSATGGGTVVSQGSASVTARGIVWSTAPNPTTGTNEGQLSLGSGTGSFSGTMTGLNGGTGYYVRAYAINAQGTAYGNQVSFTTEEETVFPPTVTTAEITDITMSSATGGGSIPDNGGAAITAKGVVWHTNSMPAVDGGQHLGITNEGSGDESFVSSITGLEPNTQYYVRAYATNSQGVAYGEQRIFITLQDMTLPTVTTADITDITQNSAKGGGEVTGDGGGDVLARGICWSVNESPTLDDHYVESGTGPGVFESDLTGLTMGATYYVRAFATNASGRAYGNQVSFTALAGMPEIEITSASTAAGEISVTADVTFDGGADITERGVVWHTEDNPTLEVNLGSSPEGTGTGQFTAVITGLTTNTFYYFAAYATNSEGTTYSGSVNVRFWDYHGTVSDIDGNVYNTVLIGGQEWMAENLKVTAYRNNVPISNLTDEGDWNNTEDGAYAWYNNDIGWKDHYGALYNWYAVSDPRGICPTGWSVPTDDDWQALVDYLGGSGVAGGKLKSTRTDPDPHPRWYETQEGVTNESGFSALPGGARQSWGFSQLGNQNNLWSSTEASSSYAWFRRLDAWGIGISRYSTVFNEGLSVRCIKD